MAAKDSYPSPPPSPAQVKFDPVLRNTLRYTISAKEYEILHKYLLTRSPIIVRKRVLQPKSYNVLVQSKDEYNAAAIRASIRVFVGSWTGLKIWELITTNVLARGKPRRYETV